MNNESDIISLVVVCDNHLVVMLSALLKSIEMNHFNEDLVDVYIISDGISQRNIEKINRTIFSEKITLIWKTLEEAIPKDVTLPLDKTTFPVCAYARICAPYFLPKNIKKAIYLDVDMLVLTDISKLWNIEIDNYTIGAVSDRSKTVGSPWGGIRNYKALGMDPDTKYFNSGLLLIDLEKWRKKNATQLVIDAVNQNINFVSFADQYGLNIVFANDWFQLDEKWNSYSQGTIKEPYVIHFTGMKPIFKGYDLNSDYNHSFFEILKYTPWSDFKPKSNYVRLLKKLLNLILKKVENFKTL